MTIRIALIGAGQRGMHSLAPYALKRPNEVRFVAVAETDEGRRARFAAQHDIAPERQYASWQELLAEPGLADALLICTSDNAHYEPTMAGLRAGYPILLEKPMSPSPLETLRMAEEAERLGKLLMICHTMRYVPYFVTLKRLVEEGRIGRIVSIQWNENVGFWHQAHSFVRGNWRNTAESSPMILAKCCHDMDMLQWLVDSPCAKVSSFGGLAYFREENAPPGSTERCTDGCAVEAECSFSALKQYYNVKTGWPQHVVSAEATLEARMKALREGPYGRCVFRCDNDVVDHQVANLVFENGVTVAFAMTAFTTEDARSFKIMGTEGEIRGHTERNEIEVLQFSGKRELIKHPIAEGGHSGGDYGVMAEFARLLRHGNYAGSRTGAAISARSHMIAFAAEQSRLSGRTVEIDEYMEHWRMQA